MREHKEIVRNARAEIKQKEEELLKKSLRQQSLSNSIYNDS
jgi:hypothetical protein